jgi:hypothetical protein
MTALRNDPRGAEGLVERARTLAEQAAEKYRRSDRFSRMRAAILGAWAVLAAATLWGACPSSGPTNPIGADVQVLRDSLVGGQQLLVRNESSAIWTDVKLTIEGGWRHERKTVRPHDQLVLSMAQFKRDGEPAPRDLKPRSLVIECNQGHFTLDLK